MALRKKAQIFASMAKLWARMPQLGDSGKILEEDRDRTAAPKRPRNLLRRDSYGARS
jgi:hypothetical protein